MKWIAEAGNGQHIALRQNADYHGNTNWHLVDKRAAERFRPDNGLEQREWRRLETEHFGSGQRLMTGSCRVRILAVYCHPDEQSFAASVRDAFLAGALDAGHEIRLLDLYAEGFDPVMSREEWRGYPIAESNEEPVRPHLEHLKWAEALVFIHPTWWYSQPAMLKGWIDRVWVPHVTFTLPTREKAMAPMMTNIRTIGQITTLGSPWWWWNIVIGAPGRKVLLRGVRACCNPKARTFFMGLHAIDNTSGPVRTRFLDKVRAKARAIR